MEKANAMARYQLFRNIAKLFQVAKVFIVLTFISWSSTRLPSAFKLSGEYFFALSTYLLNPHVVFVVGNVLIVSLYVLSRPTDVRNDDFAGKNSTNYVDASSSEELPLAEQPVTEECTIEENVVADTECKAVATVIEKATKQIERFQRTQSEKLKREISVKPRRDLRRSVTERRSMMVTTSCDEPRTIGEFGTVDRLSNEEFRLAVEAFISKQQSFLKAQNYLAENDL